MDAQQKFNIYNEHHLQKTCKICNTDNSQIYQFIFCDDCDDGYHCKCLNPPIPDHQAENIPMWLCPQCKQLQPSEGSNSQDKRQYDCYKCGQTVRKQTIHEVKVTLIGDEENSGNKCILQIQKIARCRFCRKYFHPKCFSPRLNSLNCSRCQKVIRQKSPKNHHQFYMYLNEDVDKIQDHDLQQLKPLQPEQVKRPYQRLQDMGLNIFPLITDWQLICRMQMSLYYALKTSKVNYCRTQLYPDQQLMNLNQSHFNLVLPSKLGIQDQKIYQLYRRYTRNNYFAPLQIKQDREKGFYVAALQYIPSNCLLCQYAGEVSTRKQGNKKHVQNDSVMSLIVSNFAQTSLDITPLKFSNLSRFILGIPPDRKDLQNVKTLNFCYEGRSHIIFYSTCSIQKGDLLYIDYNDGIFQEYPNQHFTV